MIQGRFRELVGSLLEWIIGALVDLNSILGLQGWLIVLTLVVSGMSYRSQKRAGIREAIEQLDPRHAKYNIITPGVNRRNPSREIQIKAGLNSFSLLHGRSKISFISNKVSGRRDRLVDHSAPPYQLKLPEQQTDRYRSLEDRLLRHEKIIHVERDNTQFVVTIESVNPVECRQIASFVLDEFDHSVNNQVHRRDFRPWPDA